MQQLVYVKYIVKFVRTIAKIYNNFCRGIKIKYLNERPSDIAELRDRSPSGVITGECPSLDTLRYPHIPFIIDNVLQGGMVKVMTAK